MRGDKTVEVPRSAARQTLLKSTEFLAGAQEGIGSHRWNAAGLNAVHAGMAAADATLIAIAGMRSASTDHGAVIALLETHAEGCFTAVQRRQLGGLLKMKNQVAYDHRLVTETEARQLTDNAVRLNAWARRVVDTMVDA